MKIMKTELIKEDYWKVKALNKSFLSNFYVSPAHAYTYKETKAKGDGKLFHELVLEPEEFNRHYVVTNYNLSTKEGRKFKEENKDKEIIKVWDFDKFSRMKENLLCNQFRHNLHTTNFGNIINNGIIEQGILATSVIDDIEFSIKIKPDIIYEFDDMIYVFDLKTVETANIKRFSYDALNYKYHWQDSLYTEIVYHHYEKTVRFIFVLVEKSPPFGVRYVELVSKYNEDLKKNSLMDIEAVIEDYHTWQLQGGDRSICYEPEIYTIEI